MSWNLVMIRSKTNSESIDEIKSENIILFRQTERANVIKKISAELNATYYCDNLSWQNLDSVSWSIEFNVDKNAEMESIMLHIRGGEPKAVFAALIADLNTRLIDCCTDEFISMEQATSFERWKTYHDKIGI